MCHAMPAKIIQLKDHQMAIVNLGGIEKEISTALLDDIHLGDYVVIHVGFALTKLNKEEAKKTLSLFAEMASLNE